jgi:phage tail sheath protein FI
MPEYLAPGVYVEEVSFRSKSIEGVSTTTTGFVGPCRYGPVDLPLDVVTGLGDFERTYGDRQQMQFVSGGNASPSHNYLWHAVRAFFEEGGRRLYVARIFKPLDGPIGNWNQDGRARATLTGLNSTGLNIAARFPGAAGNMQVRFTLHAGPSVLGQDPPAIPGGQPTPAVRGLLENDIVLLNHLSSPVASPPGGVFATAHSFFDAANNRTSWKFSVPGSGDILLANLNATPNPNPQLSDSIRTVTVTVSIFPLDPNMSAWVYSGLALDPSHQVAGAPDSLEATFATAPTSLSAARSVPIVVTTTGTDDGITILKTLLNQKSPDLANALGNEKSTDLERSIDLMLAGGNDGQRPEADDYDGFADVASTRKTGLKALEDLDDISIVAAPGSTFGYQSPGYHDQAATILNLLIAHAQNMRYRIAVLDCGEGQSVADIRAMRARIDSSYAAIYYPWITILDPVTRAEINVPPSGFVCGIYARNDINRAVYKAPANEVVNLAIGFETLLNKAQQDVLNPLGVNCFRFFEDRGFRLWGARTVSSDPEWKYVNLRRYFAYLEHSIDKGTQWAVFEPNGELLWANVRSTIEDFLLNEWQMGALLGDKPEKAYFVRCDRTTMTQNDLDNGRLVCLIGVAALRPAEYVIFRIGQWTASTKQ